MLYEQTRELTDDLHNFLDYFKVIWLREFSFRGGKTRFTHAIAAIKRTNSHNFKIKKLNLLAFIFLAVYLMNRGKSSFMNESSIRVNNTFR